MKKAGKLLFIILVALLVLWNLLFTVVDRTPYLESGFYEEMDARLDSLADKFVVDSLAEPLQIGWSRISITPSGPVPLAGYSNRDPKLMEGFSDSVFVRTVVFQSVSHKAAIVSADLLIFHPEVTSRIGSVLPGNWKMDEVYLTTTHTHSGIGGWAPGIVGTAIAGQQIDTMAAFIAEKVGISIREAQLASLPGSFSYVETDLEQLVYNRLVHEDGSTDPWLKSVLISRGSQQGILNFFSAHATCLNSKWQRLSGDFPGHLNDLIERDSIFDFSLYGASAVGSMGPVAPGEGRKRAENYAEQVSTQVELLPMLASHQEITAMASFKIPLSLRDPHVKITEDWAVRPYLFKKLAGDYQVNVSVLKLGATVFIGIPADFSGELALPLYQKAKALGLNLVITSFNGGYIGYVVKDQWYDLSKYESRSMSWYGPDNGAYLSEIIERILTIVA